MSARPDGPVVVMAALELPTDSLDIEEEVLGGLGATVLDLRDRPLRSILPELASADALLTEGIETVDAEIIGGLDRCRVISNFAVGNDRIDVAAASARGILVANVPDYCTVDVAEHTIALLLAAWRKLPRAERVARSGHWGLAGLLPLRRLSGRTLGLLGFGRIAREVAVRARGLGMVVVAHDPYVSAAEVDGVQLVARDELLRRADILSLHLPATPETMGSVDAATLAALRPGAVLVNAGRGSIVDEAALADALRSGHLAAAAADVLRAEPPPDDHPLLALDGFICTPHMAYYSDESLVDLRRCGATNARIALEGGVPATAVNASALTAQR